MSDDMRDKIAEALRAGRCCTGHIPRVADAVLSVVGPEVERLREERDQAIAHDRTRAEQAEAVNKRVRETLRVWRDERCIEPQTARLLYEVGAALTDPTPTA